MPELPAIPEAVEAADEARRISTQAREFVIVTQDDYDAAAAERTRIKTRYNEIEALRKSLKEPILAAARNVDDQFRPPLNELTAAIDAINHAAKGYLAEQERQRKAEEERLREIARKEAERLAAEARIKAAEAEELRQRAAKEAEAGRLAAAAKLEARADVAIERSEEAETASATVPVPIVRSMVRTNAAMAPREHYAFEVVDVRLVPREFLMASETAIRAYVNAMKGAAQIPGVRIWRDDVIAGRGR